MTIEPKGEYCMVVFTTDGRKFVGDPVEHSKDEFESARAALKSVVQNMPSIQLNTGWVILVSNITAFTLVEKDYA